MRKYSFLLIAVLAVLFLGLGSCSKDAAGSELRISTADLDAELNKTLAQYAAQGKVVGDEEKAELKKAILNQMVERKVMFAEADSLDIQVDKETADKEYNSLVARFPSEDAFKEALSERGYTPEMFKSEMTGILRIQKFLEEVVTSNIIIPEEEIKAYYEENPDYFASQETVNASHILILVPENADAAAKAKAKAKIDAVAAEAAAGGDFAELAKKYSEGPSGPNGGDLGSFGRGEMVKPFEDAVFALSLGQISDVVETQFGYHIIKLTGKSEPGTLSYDEAKEAIQGFLRQDKEQTAVAEFVETLKTKYTVEIPEI